MSARILIVDDDPEVLGFVEQRLKGAGYRTMAAATFEEGRRALLADPVPDLLIADVRLGHFNGLQLVLLRSPRTAVLVISGHLDRMLEAETIRLGGTYLSKPVSGTQLLEAVASSLARATPPEPPDVA
jgi:DNA-binding response OmpR family regulator